MEVEVHEGDEWSALYVDGKLVVVGDHYLSVDRVYEMFGVKTVQDAGFLRGQSQRSGVAQTLEEIAEYHAEQRRCEAALLRAEAARLEEAATALESVEPKAVE